MTQITPMVETMPIKETVHTAKLITVGYEIANIAQTIAALFTSLTEKQIWADTTSVPYTHTNKELFKAAYENSTEEQLREKFIRYTFKDGSILRIYLY